MVATIGGNDDWWGFGYEDADLGTRLTESPMRRLETRLLTRVSRTWDFNYHDDDNVDVDDDDDDDKDKDEDEDDDDDNNE